MRANFSASQYNKGSALAISLTILTAITLISVTALQRSGLQGRMVGSIQHKQQGFHTTNSELEEIYHFYATQASATQALSVPLNNFDMVAGEAVFKASVPGHTSAYSNYDSSSLGSHSASPRLQLSSSIKHTAIVDTLIDGFSLGAFVEYSFIVSAQSSKPTTGSNSGDPLSSQVMGIKYIAPSS